MSPEQNTIPSGKRSTVHQTHRYSTTTTTVILLILLQSINLVHSISISNARFSSSTYLGYISENVALPQRQLNATSHPIRIRFVDMLKPTVKFNPTKDSVLRCSTVSLAQFIKATSLRMVSDDGSTSLFDLDPEAFDCYNLANACQCHLQIKLKDDSVRYRLNREAKTSYSFQLKIDHTYAIITSVINVIILDDNDLEPMFDPSEYDWELNEFDQVPAFTKIGQVFARDPDLGRNSILRYYLNTAVDQEDEEDGQNNIVDVSEFFGVDWYTGDVFIKKSLSRMFQLAFNGTVRQERTFEFEVKSLDNGIRTRVARNLLRKQEYLGTDKKISRIRKMLHEQFLGEDSELGEAVNDGNDSKLVDMINYKLVHYAAGLEEDGKGKERDSVYWGTSIEAAYVRVKLVRSFRSRQNYDAKFRQLAKLSIKPELNEQIKFKFEKYGQILPFGLIELVHVKHLNLVAEPLQKAYSPIQFKIEQVYLSNQTTDSFLLFLQPNYTQIEQIRDLLKSGNNQLFNFTVHANDQTGQVYITDLLSFQFAFVIDLIDIIATSCRVEIVNKHFDLMLTNPSANAILAQLRTRFRSIYGDDSMCQLYLSSGLLRHRNLFHTVFNSKINQTNLRIGANSGIVRLDKIFYGQLMFQFNVKLFFNRKQIETRTIQYKTEIDNQVASILVKSIDQQPSLNNTTPIHAVVSLDDNSYHPPIVNYFRKTSTHNVFDSIQVTIPGAERPFSLQQLLNSLNWNYNEFNSYELVYCFNSNNLHKFETCPLQLNNNGTMSVIYSTDSVNLLIRIGSNVGAVDKTTQPRIKYLNMLVRNSSNYVEMEHQNCSVLVRIVDDEIPRGRLSNKLVERFNFEQAQMVPILLLRMNVKQNETNARYKFSLIEDEMSRNQLDSCFEIDSNSGDVYFKCKWPYAHHSLFKANENVARIQKRLRIKVRKYPANIDTTTYLTVQFEIKSNITIGDHQEPSFNILLFNCAQQYTEETNLKENYLINKLLSNDFKHILHKIKSSSIVTTNSHASNFHKHQFDIDYTPANNVDFTFIPAGTEIYRIDFIYLLRQLKIDDINDEAIFYEFNQLNDDMFQHNMFRLNRLTGIITLAIDWYPIPNDRHTYQLKFNVTKSLKTMSKTQNSFDNTEFTASIRFLIKSLSGDVLPKPVLAGQHVRISLSQTEYARDYLLMHPIDIHLLDSDLSVTSVYSVSYRLDTDEDVPFYVNSTSGELFMLGVAVLKCYKSDLIVQFTYNKKIVHKLRARIELISKVIEVDGKEMREQIRQIGKTPSGSIDLSMPITSVDFIGNMQCQLIGFFPISPEDSGTILILDNDDKQPTPEVIPPQSPVSYSRHSFKNHSIQSLRNRKKQRLKVRRKPLHFSVKNKHNRQRNRRDDHDDQDLISKFVFGKDRSPALAFNDTDYEQKLLWNSFYSLLQLDNSTGALYFNPTTTNQQEIYSKLARLIDFYHFEHSLSLKKLRVDATIIHPNRQDTKTSIYIDILFQSPSHQREFKANSSDVNITNKFQINSNNLLNLFNNGDEFSTSLLVPENSESDYPILNLREYFEDKVNLRSSLNLVKFNLLKTLRFYVPYGNGNLSVNDGFEINDPAEGLLSLHTSVQFDYEVEKSYNPKIMVVQYLNQPQLDITSSDQEKFVYWMDVHVDVKNAIDEPFVCDRPIYYLDMPENQVKNKKLLTIELLDFEKNGGQLVADAEKRFNAEIVSGNEQGLFGMNGLALFTGATRRRLDRETLDHHELQLQLTDLVSRRQTRCLIAVKLSDMNDNRPIVNDIELVIYDKLDTRLVDEMKIPIANAIAIDPDLVSNLLYHILSVRYLQDTPLPNHQPTASKLTKQQTSQYFTLNATNGNLYAQQMPCRECTIIIQYRASDTGKNRNRISRRSSIKLHVKKLPVSLFQLDYTLPGQASANSDTNPAIKTFDLRLRNSTRFTGHLTTNEITLNVDEDTKLGEKLFQINIEQKIALNQLAIIYFNLVGDDSNTKFYVSNNDGSLYLIKALDYEAARRYNLTVLITNWLGQIEYVHIQINVRDCNDNRPQFQRQNFATSHQVHLTSLTENISVMSASDLDILDNGKLQFNIKQCFYMPQSLLIKKDPAYPLCEQFISTTSSPINQTHQLLGLNLDIVTLRRFLHSESDFFIKERSVTLPIYMDIEVIDSIGTWSDVTRINLNLFMNSTGLVNRTQEPLAIIQSDEKLQEYGFKKPVYFLKIKSSEALRSGTELIRLFNEFVYLDSDQKTRLFRPFQLEFASLSNTHSFINVEANFGLVYFNQTINTEVLTENMLELSVTCYGASDKLFSMEKSVLYNSTKLILLIEPTALSSDTLDENLIYRPIWTTTELSAYVFENSPVNTWLRTGSVSGTEFNAKNSISLRTLASINQEVDQLVISISNFDENMVDFEIEPNTGYIRTLRMFDHEQTKSLKLSLKVCQRIGMICFRQFANLKVHIINRNDNEPKLRALTDTRTISSVADLMHSQSFYKLVSSDSDNGLDELTINLPHVTVIRENCSVLTNLAQPKNWFMLFTSGSNSTVQLSDLGFDTLVHLSSKVRHMRLKECLFTVQLVVEVSDGLFTSQQKLQLNVELGRDEMETRTVPVLTSIQLDENLKSNVNKDEYLIGLQDALVNYFTLQVHNNKSDLEYTVGHQSQQFVLENFEHLFYLNSSRLYLRKNASGGFDRESRDTYELFIALRNDFRSYSVPLRFRIMIKIADVNDNSPQFYEPIEASLSSFSPNDWTGLNRTVTWNDLVQSGSAKPLLSVKASDIDLGVNGQVEYSLNASGLRSYELSGFLLKIDQERGHVFLDPKVNATLLDLIWKTYSQVGLVLKFSIVASDMGVPKFVTELRVKFDVLFNVATESLKTSLEFKQTFYYFKIAESIELDHVFGYVGLTEKLQVVYSIVDGDAYNQFKIDFKTGALSVVSRLCFTNISSYLLTVSAYDVARPSQVFNTTVRIDLDNVYDNELEFSNYEYSLQIPESTPPMSQLIQLNVLNTQPYVSYQLLNHLDKFFMNEYTGVLYNKATFDFESSQLQPANQLQLHVIAKHRKKSPNKKHLISHPLSATCVLNIAITNTNDNPPQFEKTVYISHIQISETTSDISFQEQLVNVLPFLLDPSTHLTETNSIKFVTKVSAKDIDSTKLSYFILNQSQTGSKAHINIFHIDNKTGIITLNQAKYLLLKSLDLLDKTEFNLQLGVSDSMMTSQSRMTVHIEHTEQSHNLRPMFKTFVLNLNVDLKRFREQKQSHVRLLNLQRNVVKATDQNQFSLNTDESDVNELFSIRLNKVLVFNLNQFNRIEMNRQKIYYEVPIVVCDQREMGLCDQILVRVNLTNSMDTPLKEKVVNRVGITKDKSTSFAYKYAALTVQQTQDSLAVPLEKDLLPTYDDYYLDDSYTANERFYTEIRINELTSSNKAELEFQLLACTYHTLNVTFNNRTLASRISEFKRATNTRDQLTLKQIKSLFLLNKHNGVLSSRRTINEMLPGVYTFAIRLRSNHYYSSVILDTMRFKLIILPINGLLDDTSKTVYGYFKFSREMYKFEQPSRDSRVFGQINLAQKVQTEVLAMRNKYMTANDLSQLTREYTVINSKRLKFGSVLDNIELEKTSGELRLRSNGSMSALVEEARIYGRHELVIYALATVRIDTSAVNVLEYVCEIVLDLRPLMVQNELDIEAKFRFGRSEHVLELQESLLVNSSIYRFVAMHHGQLPTLRYSLEGNSDYFRIDSSTGVLSLANSLDKENKQMIESALRFQVKACINQQNECTDTRVIVQLSDLNDNAPVFEKSSYEGAIREDSLPGTVVLTVTARDVDKYSSQMEYFILNGDPANQFAISSDGKVYTRLMLDREQQSIYKLFILAFDGRFKALTSLSIEILNVNDNRPHCPNNMIHLNISEALPIGKTFYMANTINPDHPISNQLTYSLVPIDQSAIKTSKFTIHPTHGSLQLREPLDYETQQLYSFYIRVTNAPGDDLPRVSQLTLPWETYCMIKINLRVLDENDNSPLFNHDQYFAEIFENSPIGSILSNTTQLTASDLDSFKNRFVQYSILDKSGHFSIDPSSGVVSLAKELDRESTGDWVNITVRALDSGGLSADTHLAIRIKDQNDNKPVFQQTNLFITLQENLPAGFEVTKLNAVDSDLHSITEYYMLPGEDMESFQIDATTGELRLVSPLDYESKTSYVVRIGAFDKQLGQMESDSVVKLNIDVLDLNDNAPQFNATKAHVYLDEATPINTTITYLHAYDLDSTNSELKFKLLDNLESFSIDPSTGRLSNKVKFDFESLDQREFILTVECSDAGTNIKRKAIQELAIHIRDINDNAPRFLRNNQTIIFRETFQLGKEITRFQVTDADQNSQLTFVIIDQLKVNNKNKTNTHLANPVFSINTNGSLILIQRPPSDETYLVHVRCYDNGQPPLFTDTFLTVKVADELSNEPQMMEGQIRVVTIGSLGVHEPSSLIKIEAGQAIGNLIATDEDKDPLFYQLQDRDSKMFNVNKLTGVLKSNIVLLESARFNLKPLVTDKKFITEKELNLFVKNVNADCLQNSVYIKLNVQYAVNKTAISLKEFVRAEYMTRLTEIVARIINSNRAKYRISGQSYDASNIQIIGLREAETTEDQGISVIKLDGSLIEILFSVTNSVSTCVNSKVISKLLNRRKSVISKRMRLRNSSANFRIVDISYNSECFGTYNSKVPNRVSSQLASICSINQAFQNCHLKFLGYNHHDLCEHSEERDLRKCYLIPKYTWSCGTEERVELGDTVETGAKTYLITDDGKEVSADEDETSVEGGGSCRRPHNPCKNNAICKLVKIASLADVNYKTRIHCFCPNGFKGRFCEEDIDECNSAMQHQVPCAVGAQCVNTVGSYFCNCTRQPASLCYNQLSPQYSASRSEKYKYYGQTEREDLILNKNGIVEYVNGSPEENGLLFGVISSATVRQGLLGLFGAICGLLVILTLAAGFICQMNMTRRRMYMHEDLNSEKNTSLIENTSPLNTDSAADCLSTSDSNNGNPIINGNYSTGEDIDQCTVSVSSPSTSSFGNKQHNIPQKNLLAKSRMSKNRSSMTASLISHSDNSMGKEKRQTKGNNKYTINNLLFARLKSDKSLNTNEIAMSVCPISSSESSSGSSSPKIVKAKMDSIESKELLDTHIERPMELYGLVKESENDADDEELCSRSSTLKPIKLLAELKNDMSSFSRERPYKKKPISDSTLVRKHFPVSSSLVQGGQLNSQTSLIKQVNPSLNPKFNTLKIQKSTNQVEMKNNMSQQAGYNTISQSAMKESRFVRPINTSTFLAKVEADTDNWKPSVDGQNKNDSFNNIEDNNFQGFYWDITDWANKELDTPMHNKADSPNQIETESINSSNEFINSLFTRDGRVSQFSPIYSRNYKGIKHVNFVNEDDMKCDINLEVDSFGHDEENELKSKINFSSANNYMYLLNADECNRTTESQGIDEN